MKVLILNDYPDIVGGAERFLENLLHQASPGIVDFHRMDIADLAKTKFEVSGTSFIKNRYYRIRVFPELVRSIADRVEKISPDLIHLNNNNLFTNSVLRSLQSATIPIVSFIHDEYALRRLRSPLYINTSGQFIFLTHSRDICEDLLKMNYKAHLVKVPFNHSKWEHAHHAHCAQAQTDILYVGRIEKAKGVFKLIQAVQRVKEVLPTIKVAILGDGSKLESLKRMVTEKNLAANVNIIGMQHDQTILDYYHHSKILVFPSALESLGYVGLEAQSCGVPIVAFESKGSTRWCKDNYNGFLVKEQTPQKLADKVLEIIHDDVILTRISIAARESIRQERYNASSQEITDIYKAILS